jgi:hypothetical protein
MYYSKKCINNKKYSQTGGVVLTRSNKIVIKNLQKSESQKQPLLLLDNTEIPDIFSKKKDDDDFYDISNDTHLLDLYIEMANYTVDVGLSNPYLVYVIFSFFEEIKRKAENAGNKLPQEIKEIFSNKEVYEKNTNKLLKLLLDYQSSIGKMISNSYKLYIVNINLSKGEEEEEEGYDIESFKNFYKSVKENNEEFIESELFRKIFNQFYSSTLGGKKKTRKKKRYRIHNKNFKRTLKKIFGGSSSTSKTKPLDVGDEVKVISGIYSNQFGVITKKTAKKFWIMLDGETKVKNLNQGAVELRSTFPKSKKSIKKDCATSLSSNAKKTTQKSKGKRSPLPSSVASSKNELVSSNMVESPKGKVEEKSPSQVSSTMAESPKGKEEEKSPSQVSSTMAESPKGKEEYEEKEVKTSASSSESNFPVDRIAEFIEFVEIRNLGGNEFSYIDNWGNNFEESPGKSGSLQWEKETDPVVISKKMVQFYLDGIHDFHYNIFKSSEDELKQRGFDINIVKECFKSGITSISSLESDYLQSVLKGDEKILFNTKDSAYLPSSRVKCIWSNNITDLETHFINEITGGKRGQQEYRVLYDMGSNLSLWNNFKIWNSVMKLWDSSSGPDGGIVDPWSDTISAANNCKLHNEFSEQCFSRYMDDYSITEFPIIIAGSKEDDIVPYGEIFSESAGVLGNMPPKKLNVDAILEVLGEETIRNKGKQADSKSVNMIKKILDEYTKSKKKTEQLGISWNIARHVKHSGDTGLIISSIILQMENFIKNFSSDYPPYLYTEDLIAFGTGINYYINSTHGKKYANVFTITQNKDYSLQADDSGEGGYYLIYTEPNPPSITAILEGLLTIDIRIVDKRLEEFIDETEIEEKFRDIKEKMNQGELIITLPISILFKTIIEKSIEKQNITMLIKYLNINKKYIINKHIKQYDYNRFSFVDKSFPMSGGKSVSPSIRLQKDEVYSFFKWFWEEYSVKSYFNNFKKFMQYGFQYHGDFSYLERFCNDFENQVLNENVNILFINNTWYENLKLLEGKFSDTNGVTKLGKMKRGGKKVDSYIIKPLIFYYQIIKKIFEEKEEGVHTRRSVGVSEINLNPDYVLKKSENIETYINRILPTTDNHSILYYEECYKICIIKFQQIISDGPLGSQILSNDESKLRLQFGTEIIEKDYYYSLFSGILTILFKIEVISCIVKHFNLRCSI